MKALVQSVDGVYTIDLSDEFVLSFDEEAEIEVAERPALSLPRVVDAAASGSTIVAVVDRRPPLVVSHDTGRTWREAGGGLPPGRAVTVGEQNPDLVLYGTRNRLYLSTDGGRFWHSLVPELPEIERLAWLTEV